MPPRKSDASKVATGDEGTPMKDRDTVSVEDPSLPRAMVQRLARGVLPPNTQIAKDAVLAISKSATVFVNYLSSSANENTLRQGKKTMMPKDVLEALEDLEFEDFLPRLEAELAKYNEVQLDKRDKYRKKAADKAALNGSPFADGGPTNGTAAQGADSGDSPPAAKKVRRSTLGPADANGVSPGRTEAEQAGNSGDETISEEEAEQEGDDEVASEDEVADDDAEETAPEGDTLETQDREPPDDEALDNGEDSD
ncbi:MAG: hypothetical protein M1832_000664 [Thelocarpon impressellum]|nr:MAG: hypothetical protein M1832_000664 [Thelocarpon impressellum]